MPDKTTAYRMFSIVNHIFLLVISLLCVLPIIHILAVSLSGKSPAAANLVGLWPIDFTFDAYKKTFGNDNFLHALFISAERTILGTFIGMALVFLAAYPLSKEQHTFRGRSVYAWYFIFTMLFSGGMVPGYILITKLHLLNSIWALILPGAVNVWLMILMLNFFRTVPKELEEAAMIDGASHYRILLSVFMPVSMPAVATLALFTMVGHWNSWFDGMLYMTNHANYPLATLLQTIVQQDYTKLNVRPEELENIAQRTVKSAQLFIGALPILTVYPFLQKYFVKGIVLGSVKE
ncbi:carbohydrate ABC transporter permease [Paenibacillus sp. BC26]|uniref:carbohydrate ABC transporter permease n=1 Tax=Paenibacillus sp. BC26 TaxID=1881032 RepID=UPI0008F34E4F|nr:carbohydrate ABC transporter permease [Paenibacillus sp. BC26]SFT14861.1 putative aldouronate transport system permease protein [Paenibacillus sp. BC26]